MNQLDLQNIRRILNEHQYLGQIYKRIGISEQDRKYLLDNADLSKDYYMDPNSYYWLPKKVYYLIPNNL